MPKKSVLTRNEQNLIRRYLTWCYKTTKEDLDRVDRYFTQLKADGIILDRLKRAKEYRTSQEYKALVDQFKVYMEKKEANVPSKKFKDGRQDSWNADYLYLTKRFAAIEETICRFLGKNELKRICALYEQEMTRRILQAREHT